MEKLTLPKEIIFNKPDLGEEEIAAISDVIRSGWIGTGKLTTQFEEEFAKLHGGGYAVAVSSCSIGLRMVLEKIKTRNEVITTPLTFAATLNAIIHSGKKPIFVDVDKKGNINVDEINNSLKESLKIVLPVHYSGNPVDIFQINPKAVVIEDCAHAFGMQEYSKNTRVYSFYPNKNITCGEGGMIWTLDKNYADELRILGMQGLNKGAWNRFQSVTHYHVEQIGFKANLPDILAAVGIVQLRRWPEMRNRRKKIWEIYEDAFGVMNPYHSMHFYPILLKNRDNVREKLNNYGIGTGIHYFPLHLEPAYSYLGYRKGDFPNAEMYGECELSLPVSSTMSEEDANLVVDKIKKYGDVINAI